MKPCYILIIIVSLITCGCSIAGLKSISPEEVQIQINKAKNSKLIVLDVYHNHCETCKFIEPVIKKLESSYSENPDIVFLKYDLSNLFTIGNSLKIAKELGIEKIYKSEKYSGIVLFISTEEKQIQDKLIGEYDINKYTEIIENKLKKNNA